MVGGRDQGLGDREQPHRARRLCRAARAEKTATRAIELAGSAQFNPVTPEPELKSDGKPSIATEITAGEPVIRSFVWVDDRPYRATLAPDEVLLTADVPTRLPPGRHVVVTFAETQSSSGANAYSFEVG